MIRDVKTFVDSRVDIFEYAGVLQDYLDPLTLKDPNAILDKYKIRSSCSPPRTAYLCAGTRSGMEGNLQR